MTSRPSGDLISAESKSDLRNASRVSLFSTLKWRWYHLYFVLAMFDVAIILASVLVHHQTLRSFNRALTDVTDVHQRQRWFADMSTALLELNAPGNDIFESHDLAGELAKFTSAKVQMVDLLKTPPGDASPPGAFEKHVERMIDAEEKIFEYFRQMENAGMDSPAGKELLPKATKAMAAMDRAQANAMSVVTNLSLSSLVDQQFALDRHKSTLDNRTKIEALFVAIVGIILLGIFWYGRQLQKTNDRLLEERERVVQERNNRLAAVGEVCFSCAHGIRNPLAAIASSAQLLLECGTYDPNSRKRVEDILHTCSRLNHRLTRLLAFAKVPALNLEPVGVEEVLDQAAEELAPGLDSRGLEVRKNYRTNQKTIHADRHLLVQAIVELLSNSMDELPHGGVITLVSGLSRNGQKCVEFGVTDNGPGIPDEVKDRVCELFYSRKTDGTGIGLASVAKTAQLHGGSVIIADVDPTGADVRIQIPIASRDAHG